MRRRRRTSRRQYRATASGNASSSHRAGAATGTSARSHSTIGSRSALQRDDRWRNATGGQLAAPLAQLREAQQRRVERLVGGQLEAVDAGLGQRRRAARPRAARPPRRSAGGTRGRACRRSVARRSPRPASRSVPRSGSSTSIGSYSRTATTSCRRASCASRRPQPGVLMKSDTTKIDRAPLDHRLRKREQLGKIGDLPRRALPRDGRRPRTDDVDAIEHVQHMATAVTRRNDLARARPACSTAPMRLP